jgi:hypothetical protein
MLEKMNIEVFIKSVDLVASTQVIAGILAIVYARKIATNQVKSQYDDSHKLQSESEQNKIYTLTVAINRLDRIHYS